MLVVLSLDTRGSLFKRCVWAQRDTRRRVDVSRVAMLGLPTTREAAFIARSASMLWSAGQPGRLAGSPSGHAA